MTLTALFSNVVRFIEEILSLLPVLLVETYVSHAQKTLELHPYSFQITSDANALSEVVLGLLNISLQQVGNRELPVA